MPTIEPWYIPRKKIKALFTEKQKQNLTGIWGISQAV